MAERGRGAAIVIVGIRGAGKTTLGAALAARLRRVFIDLDAAIAARAKRPITAIFAEEGEEGFRRRESAALREVAARARRGARVVVATGGGVVERRENLPLLRGAGRVLWLQCSSKTVAQRLTASRARPSLSGRPVETEVRALLARRAPRYRAVADSVLRSGKAGVEELVDRAVRSKLLHAFA